MQKVARITSKGQITVPHEIRRLLGVKPGDGLVFESDGTRTEVRPVRTRTPFEKYRGIGNGRAGSGRKAVVRAIRELRGRGNKTPSLTILRTLLLSASRDLSQAPPGSPYFQQISTSRLTETAALAAVLVEAI